MLRPGVFVVAVASLGSVAMAENLGIAMLGKLTLSGTSTDQTSAVITPNELSGITWSGSGGLFYVVSDSSDHVISLNVTTAANGEPVSASFGSSLKLNLPGSDLEGIAYSPSKPNSIFVSNEATNSILEYNRTSGALIQTITPTLPSSARPNFSLESLAITGNTLWTANEEALTNDGALSTPSAGTVVRLQQLNIAGSTATEVSEHAYPTQPIHGSVSGDTSALSRSGVSDIVALPDGRLIVLERSFAYNSIATSYQSRMYEVDPNTGMDVSGIAALNSASYTLVGKDERWSATTNLFSGSNAIGNLEGIALGPQLSNGNYLLVGITDDGAGGDPLSGNRLVFFSVSGISNVPEPASLSLLFGLGSLLLRRRAL